MKTLLLLFALVGSAYAQTTLGFGGQPASAFATTVQQCQTITSGYFLCVVDPGAGVQPFLAMSVFDFNSGAPFQLSGAPGPMGPQGPAGAQGPVGPQGPPGTNTSGNILALIASGGNSSLAPSATGYFSLSGPHPENSFAATVEAMLPFNGTVDTLCVRTVTGQSGGALTVNLYDATTSTVTPVTVTVPALAAPGVYCDTTDSAPITAQHDYVLKAVNTWTAASATVTGISARYSY